MGPSRACTLSSPLMLLLLGPRHSIVVGARARSWVVGCRCVHSRLWAVGRCCAHWHSWVVGRCCAHLHSWAVVGHCVHERLWAVSRGVHVSVRRRLMVVLGSHVICCVLTMFMGIRIRGRLLVVIGGDRCGWWLACVVVEQWWSGPVVVIRRLLMVVVRRKEATSHILTMASHLNICMRSHVNDLTCNDLM